MRARAERSQPALTQLVAKVCRRAWKLMSGTFASLRKLLNARCRVRGSGAEGESESKKGTASALSARRCSRSGSGTGIRLFERRLLGASKMSAVRAF